MSEDRNTNLHNLNDETPELERVHNVQSDEFSSEKNGDETSLFEQEKSDLYYDELDADLLAQAEAEVEAQLQLSEKRKRDKEKARKSDAKAFKAAREQHERNMAEENIRRARMEEESAYRRTDSFSSKNDNYVDNTSSYHNVPEYKSENSNLYGYGYTDASVGSPGAPIVQPLNENIGATISDAEYITLRENYENSKNIFKSYEAEVPDAVVEQYKADMDSFFAVQRKIDQGDLTVLPAQTYEPSKSLHYDGDQGRDTGNGLPGEKEPQNNYISHYPESSPSNSNNFNKPFDDSYSPTSNEPHSKGYKYSKDMGSVEGTSDGRSGFNSFEQNMARYANTVYSQTSYSTPGGDSSVSSSNALVINNITRARYESLKQKYADINNEIASYGGKDVPKETMRKAEQANRLFSAIESKIENGTLNVVDSVVIDKNTKRGSNVPSGTAGALGTQVFYDKSRDNFSPSGKRVGNSHIKPVGTPFHGASLDKYDKLKIHHALELGSPLENATRRSYRAVGSTVMAVASSEQSGTANMMLSGQDRARDVVNTAKAMKDLPRQLKVACQSVQDAATSARNVGRFISGKELIEKKDRNPLTVKQINKQLNVNPFTSAEKDVLKKKFGTNVNVSKAKLDNKVLFNTAKNKNLKEEIKKLQAQGASLSGAERKRLKSLLDEKKAADVKLRKLHGLKKAQQDAAIRNRAADRTTKKSVEKTIKKNAKAGKKLSKRDKGLLSRLKDRKNLLEQRKKLFKATAARKQLATSLGGALGKAMHESEESAIQGVLGASRIIQNRYVRTVLKVATKTALLPVVGARKLTAAGLRKLDSKLGVSSAVKKQIGKIQEKAVRKVINSRPYKELNGGLYNRARKKISSKVPDRIKTRVNKGKKTLNNLNSKRKKVLDKFNDLKNRLKSSKLGRFVSKLGSGFGKLANAFKFIKTALIKVGFACGSVVLIIIFLGAVVTSVGGASTSLFLGDDSGDGRIDLTKYVEVLNKEEQDFLAEIDDIASDPGDKYENITVNYQSGALVNNFKEILSMTAVYFNQDFSNNDAVNTYIKQLYNDSHYYTTVESEPYKCSGCEKREYLCTKKYDKYATETRKQLYDQFAEEGGCTHLSHGTSVDSPAEGCDSYYQSTSSGRLEYICFGHEYCPGHTEKICRGKHVDLDVNVMVLGFNDVFYADTSAKSSITGLDTSTGNVTKGEEIGTFTITYYCTERYPHICNAGPPYKTASGTAVTPGRTIAVDKSVIPLKTHVIINGHEYIAEDTGGGIKGNRIDVAVATHAEALKLGKKTYKVYYATDKGADESERSQGITYLEYASDAATDAFNKRLVLQAFGQAKEPVVEWSFNRVNYDNENSFTKKLNEFDSDHKSKPFTNAELNTFEYVKMSKKKLVKLAKNRTGKDYSDKSIYNIIVDVLIPYDKNHPDVYVVDPNSVAAKEYTFEGWTEDNIEWVKNIYSLMDEENYAGLDKINQFSGDNVSYEGIEFKQGKTKVVYYSQYDVRWKNLPYSSSTIGKSGCAPTSMAMIVSSLTKQTVDPIQMCNWAASKGYYIKGEGTSWSFVTGAAANWGLSCRDMGKGNAQQVVSALSKGKLVIMSTGSGSYYQGDGHFLVLRGVDENGQILVADPANKVKSETSWTLAQIMSGLKNWWIIG